MSRNARGPLRELPAGLPHFTVHRSGVQTSDRGFCQAGSQRSPPRAPNVRRTEISVAHGGSTDGCFLDTMRWSRGSRPRGRAGSGPVGRGSAPASRVGVGSRVSALASRPRPRVTRTARRRRRRRLTSVYVGMSNYLARAPLHSPRSTYTALKSERGVLHCAVCCAVNQWHCGNGRPGRTAALRIRLACGYLRVPTFVAHVASMTNSPAPPRGAGPAPNS